MNQIQIKINKPLKNYKANTVISIAAGKNKLPIEPYWRNRLKDAEIDNCISIVKKTTQDEVKKLKMPEKQESKQQDKQKDKPKPKLGDLNHDS
jgi:hypothetical protein